MARLNLLPPERKAVSSIKQSAIKKGSSFSFNWLLPAIWILIGIVILVSVFFKIKTVLDTQALTNLDTKNTEAINQKNIIQQKKQVLTALETEVAGLESYFSRDLVWSEKLSQLRELMPEVIWLTELNYEKRRKQDNVAVTLTLRGALIPEYKKTQLGTLSNFMSLLKEDSAFSAEFNNPILTDYRAETRKNVETMFFSVELPLKISLIEK